MHRLVCLSLFVALSALALSACSDDDYGRSTVGDGGDAGVEDLSTAD